MNLLASLLLAGVASALNATLSADANAPTSTASCSTIQYHADYYGNDIASTQRDTVDACCDDCSANPDCVIAVWYEGTCWLKNVVGIRTELKNAMAVYPRRSSDDDTPAPTDAPSTQSLPLHNVQGGYAYAKAHRQGTYNMVTELKGCQTRVEASSGPIAPYHEDTTFVFRGPMDIYNIAIFQPTSSNDWARVSSYDRTSATNLVFMNNANPQKYNGLSPQGYATADGLGFAADQPKATAFRGRLDDGANPSDQYGGPGITTGAEVNIMQPQRCTADTCKGYFDKTYGVRGWSGSKVFVTKYGCNCRGRADPGGCGELDIAEAIQRGSSKLSTHNYWLNANPSDGHDTWTTRPTGEPATFVTILDERSGVIKVLRLGGNDFAAFNVDRISADAMQALIQHPIK